MLLLQLICSPVSSIMLIVGHQAEGFWPQAGFGILTPVAAIPLVHGWPVIDLIGYAVAESAMYLTPISSDARNWLGARDDRPATQLAHDADARLRCGGIAGADRIADRRGAELASAIRFFPGTGNSRGPVTLGRWFAECVFGVNGDAYWPMHPSSTVSYAKRIRLGAETSPGCSAGCYLHGINGIFSGDYTQFPMNVGIQRANHDPYNLSEQLSAPPIGIGKYCLLGMGSLILGVVLGEYTIVVANAAVTKPFPQGFVVLARVPARIISELDPALVADDTNEKLYNGYIPAAYFDEFCQTTLQLPELPQPAATS